MPSLVDMLSTMTMHWKLPYLQSITLPEFHVSLCARQMCEPLESVSHWSLAPSARDAANSNKLSRQLSGAASCHLHLLWFAATLTSLGILFVANVYNMNSRMIFGFPCEGFFHLWNKAANCIVSTLHLLLWVSWKCPRNWKESMKTKVVSNAELAAVPYLLMIVGRHIIAGEIFHIQQLQSSVLMHSGDDGIVFAVCWATRF